MPNELNIALATTGLTVTAQPYQNGAAVGSAISCPETGSAGFYSGNMAGSAGTYQIAFRSAGANVGSGSIVWDGTAEVASSAPSAAQNAAAVWSQTTRTVTGGTVDTLTNAPTVPSASAIASQVRTELSVELGRVDASISSRATAANIPTSDITAIKAKTDNLPASPAATGDIPTESEIAAEVWAKPTTELTITGSIGERAKNQSTVSTTGAQLAAALS
jgi:hypothetical protein